MQTDRQTERERERGKEAAQRGENTRGGTPRNIPFSKSYGFFRRRQGREGGTFTTQGFFWIKKDILCAALCLPPSTAAVSESVT